SGSKFRRHLSLHDLIFRTGHRRSPNSVKRSDAVERTAGTFECDDRVFESGWRGIAGDALNFREPLSDRGFECGFEEWDLHAIKRWHTAVRAFPICEQRIFIGRCM